VFSLGQEFKLLDEIAGEHTFPEFVDVDRDGIYEVKCQDWTFAYWETSFAESPAPEIILRYRNGKYVLAADLMKRPAKSPYDLEKEIVSLRKQFGGPERALNQDKRWSGNGGVPPVLWAFR
jgi:hypothetical protein